MSINRLFPGPAIHVCHNDLIVVDVVNMMGGTATSIHWHGFLHEKTPWMDGVPYVKSLKSHIFILFSHYFIKFFHRSPNAQFNTEAHLDIVSLQVKQELNFITHIVDIIK